MGAVKVPSLASLEWSIVATLPGKAKSSETVLAARDEAEHGCDDSEHGTRAHVCESRDGEVENDGNKGTFRKDQQPKERDRELVLPQVVWQRGRHEICICRW